MYIYNLNYKFIFTFIRTYIYQNICIHNIRACILPARCTEHTPLGPSLTSVNVCSYPQVFIHMYTCIHIHIYVFIIYVHVFPWHASKHMHTFALLQHLWRFLHIYNYKFICTFICMYIHINKCICDLYMCVPPTCYVFLWHAALHLFDFLQHLWIQIWGGYDV